MPTYEIEATFLINAATPQDAMAKLRRRVATRMPVGMRDFDWLFGCSRTEGITATNTETGEETYVI